MIEFRDQHAAELGVKLIVHTNRKALEEGANPFKPGNGALLRIAENQALLDGLRAGNYDAAFGGARRDEEKSRAKERIYSFRDSLGQWDPKNQRPELWNIYQQPHRARRKHPRISAFQLDGDGCLAIHPPRKHSDRAAVLRQGARSAGARQFADHAGAELSWVRAAARSWKCVKCRMRSLGCSPCTGAIRSDADTIPKIIAELVAVRNSERENRVIDHDREGSMELKKREGYF